MKMSLKQVDEVAIPKDIAVFQDARTKARSFALPVDFPDGFHGVIIVTRLSRSPWTPSQTIKSVTISYQPYVD